MNADYSRQVADVVDALVLEPSESFTWFGRRLHIMSDRLRKTLGAADKRALLLYALQTHLYHQFYVTGAASPDAQSPLRSSTDGEASHIHALSQANSGKGSRRRGWIVQNVETTSIVALKDDLRVKVLDHLFEVEDSFLAVGSRVSLLSPKEQFFASPGYYLALSEAPLEPTAPGDIVRVYWNLNPRGAVALMRQVSGRFNEARLPFHLKALNAPMSYVRADAATLYLPKAHYARSEDLLRECVDAVAPFLGRFTPSLTKPLAPGVGVAENPTSGESFGLYWCRLLSEGLLYACDRGMTMRNERLEAVLAHVAGSGRRIEHPYLNPGSSPDSYAPLRGSRPQHPTHIRPATTAAIGSAGASSLAVANQIAQTLVRCAIWHGDQCNWLAHDLSTSDGSRDRGAIYRPLGPDLYSGTTGIAWFLAEHYHFTGDAESRRTAQGAIRHAGHHARKLLRQRMLGLYEGALGIVLSASRAAGLLCDEELLDMSEQLVNDALSAESARSGPDLMSGSAGTIIALLCLARLTPAIACETLAIRLGDALIENAEALDGGFAWTSPGSRRRRLTGLSHGSAGVGLAMVELHQATGEPRFLESARLAFEFERRWFDRGAANWADLREQPRRLSSNQTRRFATAWCHGAPGIALSRLRAYQVTGDEAYRAEALRGLATTRRWLEQALHGTAHADFSLCHGLSGNAEVLSLGAELLDPQQVTQEQELIDLVDARLAAMFQEPDSATRSIIAQGGPGVMTGVAGLARFFLRRGHDQMPSLLLIRPDDMFAYGVEPTRGNNAPGTRGGQRAVADITR